MSQAADGPAGFSTCHKFDCTTAKSSLDASNYILFFQTIEAQKPSIIGLWVIWSQARLRCLSMSNQIRSERILLNWPWDATNASSNSQAYTINSADTWERKTLTYAAQTVDVINNDSGEGMNIFFWLGAGSHVEWRHTEPESVG